MNTNNWKEYSEFLENNLWMDYSSQIARRIYAAIKNNKKVNQEKLATDLGVKPQYISRVLKGRENLTLKTIYNLSKALNCELISFPPYEYSQPLNSLGDSEKWQTKINVESKVVPIETYHEYKLVK
jgi:transcriptional regulator with XRE-family HTH domain